MPAPLPTPCVLWSTRMSRTARRCTGGTATVLVAR
ncbi:hypothetical protein FHR93_001969 [Geodermatophilus sabuli]|nr:hypothetical protein [Geodermatophilus sabuli]